MKFGHGLRSNLCAGTLPWRLPSAHTPSHKAEGDRAPRGRAEVVWRPRATAIVVQGQRTQRQQGVCRASSCAGNRQEAGWAGLVGSREPVTVLHSIQETSSLLPETLQQLPLHVGLPRVLTPGLLPRHPEPQLGALTPTPDHSPFPPGGPAPTSCPEERCPHMRHEGL